jgi:adhesin transport system outer membrane protein
VLNKKGKFTLNILVMINGRGASMSKTSLILSILILAACSTTPDANIDRDGLIQSELVRPSSASQEALPAPVSGIENTKSTYYYSDIVGADAITEGAELTGAVTVGSTEPDMSLGGLDDAIQVQGVRSGLGDTLTFEEALSVVWQDHPKVIKALTELEATDYDLKGAKTGYYPYLSVTSVEASNDASNTQLNLIQPIWDGGLTTAEVSEARGLQKAAIASLNQVRLDLAVETSEAYLNVLSAEEQGRLWGRYMASLEGLLNAIKRRADMGASPMIDIQTAVSRLSQAKAGFAASKATLLTNRLHLSSLLHIPFDELHWPSGSYRLTDAEVGLARQQLNFTAHPAGQAVLADIEIQRARVKASKAALFPTVSLQYSNQLAQSAGDFTPDSSTQLVLQYNTGSGLRGVTSFQAAEHRLRGAFQDLAFARRDVGDIISRAYAEREVSLQQFSAQVEAAESSVQLVDSFLRQFKVGRKQWIEVLNAHREAHEALLQISVIKRSYWSANMRLAIHGMVWGRISNLVPPTDIKFETQ